MTPDLTHNVSYTLTDSKTKVCCIVYDPFVSKKKKVSLRFFFFLIEVYTYRGRYIDIYLDLYI